MGGSGLLQCPCLRLTFCSFIHKRGSRENQYSHQYFVCYEESSKTVASITKAQTKKKERERKRGERRLKILTKKRVIPTTHSLKLIDKLHETNRNRNRYRGISN